LDGKSRWVARQGPTEDPGTAEASPGETGAGRFGGIPPGGPDRAASEVVVASRSTADGHDRGGRGDRGRESAGGEGRTGHVVTHHAAVTIRRPPGEVAAYVFDPTTMPHWSGILYEIEPVTEIEPRLGRRLRANFKILGVCLTVEGELLDIDLQARQGTVRVVPVGGGGAIEHRLAVEELSPDGQGAPGGPEGAEGREEPVSHGGSLLRFWNRIEVPPWLSDNLSDSLIRRFIDHTASFALANIKDVLEHGEEAEVRQLQHRARPHVPAPTRLQP
jgi:hypothetical protein